MVHQQVHMLNHTLDTNQCLSEVMLPQLRTGHCWLLNVVQLMLPSVRHVLVLTYNTFNRPSNPA